MTTLKEHYERAKRLAAEAAQLRDQLRDQLRAVCPHTNVFQDATRLPHGPNYRTCTDCDLREVQPTAETGDEYDWPRYGSFEVLAGQVRLGATPKGLRVVRP